MAAICRRLKAEAVVTVNRNNMSALAWARFFYPSIRTLYVQNMQLGMPKRDLIHTLRFNRLSAWISPLPYLKEQVLDYTRINPEKVFELPMGIELDRFISAPDKQKARHALALPEGALVIGLLGRLDPQKGQMLLLEAFKKWNHPEAQCVFMGESTRGEGEAYEQSLKAYVADHGLEGKVHFRPYRKDVEWFYAAIDWFVMASMGETYGMVTVEALVSGKLVIGSNASGTPELLLHGKRGITFEPGDAESLVLALEEASKSDLNTDAIATEAQRMFSHDAECEGLEKILTTVRKS